MMKNIMILALLGCSSLFASLSVTSVNPSSGAVDQGGAVAVEGTGFTSINEVLFGSVKSTNFLVLSDNAMSAIAPVPLGPSGLVHVMVANASEVSPISYQNRYVFTRGEWLAYFTHAASSPTGSIIPFALSEGNAAPANISIGGSTSCLAITPNNTRLYAAVSNSPLGYSVVVVDIAKNLVINAIPFSKQPVDIVISASGMIGYVISDQQLSQIDLTTSLIISQLELPFKASQLAITPDGQTAFVSHYHDNRISMINLTQNVLNKTISIKGPYGMGIDPAGDLIYVTTGLQHCYALNTKTGAIHKRFLVGNDPRSVAVNPNGNEVYVGNYVDGTVSVIKINCTGRHCSLKIPVGMGPSSIAISPDGSTGYVNNALDGTMSSIDLNTHMVLNTEPIDPALSGIAITPDQCPIANFKIASFDGFLTYTFDASASITPVGEIATYTWNFEGSTVTTTSPFISHQFGVPGSYPVTLTVTNSAGTSTTPIFTGKSMNRNGGSLAQIVWTVNVPWPIPPASSN